MSFDGRGPGTTTKVSAPGFELKERDKKRVIHLGAFGEAAGLCETIPYLLDKDRLTLTFEDGLLKGEHKLTRVKK